MILRPNSANRDRCADAIIKTGAKYWTLDLNLDNVFRFRSTFQKNSFNGRTPIYTCIGHKFSQLIAPNIIHNVGRDDSVVIWRLPQQHFNGIPVLISRVWPVTEAGVFRCFNDERRHWGHLPNLHLGLTPTKQTPVKSIAKKVENNICRDYI